MDAVFFLLNKIINSNLFVNKIRCFYKIPNKKIRS